MYYSYINCIKLQTGTTQLVYLPNALQEYVLSSKWGIWEADSGNMRVFFSATFWRIQSTAKSSKPSFNFNQFHQTPYMGPRVRPAAASDPARAARMVLIFGDTVLLPLALAWDVSMGVDNLFSPWAQNWEVEGDECWYSNVMCTIPIRITIFMGGIPTIKN